MPKEVFLSHSSNNIDVATAISETLINHGVPVWYSPINIMPSQQWHDEIGRALKRCDWFMVLISEDSISSEWVKRELMYALTHRQYYDAIMPVMIEDCDYEELSWTLCSFQIIDFDNDAETAYRQMLRTWGIGLDSNNISPV